MKTGKEIKNRMKELGITSGRVTFDDGFLVIVGYNTKIGNYVKIDYDDDAAIDYYVKISDDVIIGNNDVIDNY